MAKISAIINPRPIATTQRRDPERESKIRAAARAKDSRRRRLVSNQNEKHASPNDDAETLRNDKMEMKNGDESWSRMVLERRAGVNVQFHTACGALELGGVPNVGRMRTPPPPYSA